MKAINFISEAIYVDKTGDKGRGVFTRQPLQAKTIIEIAPVIVMSGHDRFFIDQTLLHDYIFEWGDEHKQCCMALGYVPLYNHSYHSNCEYEMNFKKQIITIKTVRAIEAGEELFINYNGDWNNEKEVWFPLSP
ncbi:MAG: SET domain-containing protein [Flavisolibacter sp.]